MTTATLLKTLRKSGKPVCLSHLYRLFLVLDIKPLGRSRPQLYPPDTAERIKAHFGLPTNPDFCPVVKAPAWLPPLSTSKKLVTVAQLRAAKPSKRKGSK